MLSERRSVGEYVIYLQLLFHSIVVSHTILILNSKEAKYCMAQNSSFITREFLSRQTGKCFILARMPCAKNYVAVIFGALVR